MLGLVSEPNSSFYSKEQNGFDFQNSQKNFYRPDGHKVGNGFDDRKSTAIGLCDRSATKDAVIPQRRNRRGPRGQLGLSDRPDGDLSDCHRDHRAKVQREPELSSADRHKTQLAANANTAHQYIEYTPSALHGIDEMDPILGELDLQSDRSAIAFLHAREEAFEEEQFCGHLMAHMNRLKSTSEDITGGMEPGEPVPSEAATQKRRLRVTEWVKKVRQKELAKKQALAASARGCANSCELVDKSVLEDWEAKESFTMEPNRMSLSSWWSRCEGRRSEYAGLGYSSTISQYVRSRCEASAIAQATAPSSKKSSALSSVQRLERRLQREARLVEGENVFLALEPFCQSGPCHVLASGGSDSDSRAEFNSAAATHPKKSSYVISGVFEEDVYSIVDSGTTITIKALMVDTKLDNYDAKASVKIMGFNGSVSRSTGKGTIVGFARSAQGRRVSYIACTERTCGTGCAE